MNNHRTLRLAASAVCLLATFDFAWAGGMKHHSKQPQAYDWQMPRDLDTDTLGVDFSRETDPMYGYGVDESMMRSRRTGTSTYEEPTDVDTDQQGVDTDSDYNW